MEIMKEELKKRYGVLADDQIMDLYLDGGLTEDAKSILEAEIEKRGLTSENIAKRKDQKDIEEGLAEPEIKIDQFKLQQLVQEFEANQNLLSGIIGGIIGAALGAVVWGAVTFGSGYQFGFVAIGVGAIVGYSVRIAGKGISPIFGIIGGVLALVSCLAGNIFGVCAFYAKENGIPILTIISHLNPKIIAEILSDTFSVMDVLFYAIAIYAGYRISFRNITEKDLERITSDKTTPVEPVS